MQPVFGNQIASRWVVIDSVDFSTNKKARVNRDTKKLCSECLLSQGIGWRQTSWRSSKKPKSDFSSEKRLTRQHQKLRLQYFPGLGIREERAGKDNLKIPHRSCSAKDRAQNARVDKYSHALIPAGCDYGPPILVSPVGKRPGTEGGPLVQSQ